MAAKRIAVFSGKIRSINALFFRKRRKEERATSAREFDTYQELSLRKTPETSSLFDGSPLRDQYPETFRKLVAEYESLIEDAISERFFKVDHRLQERLVALAQTLGGIKAGAKDVMDIHRQGLAGKTEGVPHKKVQIVLEESRYMLITLLGNLLNLYRKKSY
jgi:hypothetical protein